MKNKNKLYISILSAFLLCTASSVVLAQEENFIEAKNIIKPPAPVTPSSSSEPVEISAAGSLEWDKNQQSYTAKKDVIVKQGDIKIECDSLTASYNDPKTMSDVSTLTAIGNVRISSAPYIASGEMAVYDVVSGVATLTGKKVTVTTESDILTTNDKIEFIKADKKLVAYGNPVIKHKLDTIKSKTMTAYFKDGADGKMISDRMEATGGVTIKTQAETITSNTINYDSQTRKAILTGNVVVEKGGNRIQGTKAVVDMNTGISQLLGGEISQQGDGRVKGVFYPKKNNK